MTEAQIYAEAGKIIQIAMGRTNQVAGRYRRRQRVWAANEDPLACVLGIEAIVSLVNRAKLEASPNAEA